MSFNPYKTKGSLFIIAEIGINHNGDLKLAKKLIRRAKKAGCDAVKFQKRAVDIVYTSDYLDSPRDSPWGTTQRHQKEGLEFGKREYDEIDNFCNNVGILWSASAWDEVSQNFLQQYNLSFNKIASPMLVHKELLELVAKEQKHTFVSTGMSTFRDIDRAVKIFEKYDCPYTLMHCVSKYPLEDADCNISMVSTLADRYACPIGYSGHEKGVLPSILAVALGATVVERHITLDRTMYGSDQSASLEFKGLNLLVRDARRVMTALGDGEKRILENEIVCANKLRYFSKNDFSWKS